MDLPSDFFIGFIGAGNMTFSIVKGFVNIGKINPKKIAVSATSITKESNYHNYASFFTNNQYLVDEVADSNAMFSILFLAVKPYVFLSKRDHFKSLNISRNVVVVSVMAGITMTQLKEVFPNNLVYRTMPNTSVEVGSGVWVAVKETNSPTDQFISSLLSSVSFFTYIHEKEIDAVSGLAGSGIAFVYTFIQALSDGGVKMGLPRSLSQSLASQVVLGGARMVQNSEKHPYKLRDNVCSPGGSTIAGIHHLEKTAMFGSVMDAVEIASLKAKELGIIK